MSFRAMTLGARFEEASLKTSKSHSFQIGRQPCKLIFERSQVEVFWHLSLEAEHCILTSVSSLAGFSGVAGRSESTQYANYLLKPQLKNVHLNIRGFTSSLSTSRVRVKRTCFGVFVLHLFEKVLFSFQYPYMLKKILKIRNMNGNEKCLFYITIFIFM